MDSNKFLVSTTGELLDMQNKAWTARFDEMGFCYEINHDWSIPYVHRGEYDIALIKSGKDR